MNAMNDPAGLNPGIVGAVNWLTSRGFKTCDSGDGRAHDFECDRDWPYVVIMVEPGKMVEEAGFLRDAFTMLGIDMSPAGPLGSAGTATEPVGSGTKITASWAPGEPTAIIEIDFLPGDETKLCRPGTVETATQIPCCLYKPVTGKVGSLPAGRFLGLHRPAPVDARDECERAGDIARAETTKEMFQRFTEVDLDKLIKGNLKSCIDAHGSITTKWINSAAKRIRRSLLAEVGKILERLNS